MVTCPVCHRIFKLDFATIVPNEKRYPEKSPHISL
jgi:hypothetical protein